MLTLSLLPLLGENSVIHHHVSQSLLFLEIVFLGETLALTQRQPVMWQHFTPGMVHASVGQKLVKSNKLQVFLLSDDKFWTLHLRLQTITNAIWKLLVHVLIFCSSPPPPTNYTSILIKPFSFVWYIIPLLKTGALASTRDLLLTMKKLVKTGVCMTDCNYWLQYLPNDSV